MQQLFIKTIFVILLVLIHLNAFAQKKDIHLKIEPSKDSATIGELVYVNLVIYTKVGIEAIELLTDFEPSKDSYSFYSQNNYKFDETVVQKELNGKTYYYKVLRQYILYPLKTGELVLPNIKVQIGQKQANSFQLDYSTLALEQPCSIFIDSLPKESQFAPKNGKALAVTFNDSLAHKGIWIVDVQHYALCSPMFIHPVDFELGDKATVEVLPLSQGYKKLDYSYYSTRTFRHTISFHQKGEYTLNPQWKTWNSRNKKWAIVKGQSKTVSINKTRIKKDSHTNIKPFLKDPKVSEDVVFLVDVSSSMLAKDFSPNRYETVKNMLKKMISSKSPDQQISIVVFSGEAMTLCPLLSDSTQLLNIVDKISIGKLKDGTAIGDGILLGLYELSKSNSKNKHLFMLTDGINNTGTHNPFLASLVANKLNIQVHSFGVGCNGVAQVPVARRPNGSYVFGDAKVEIDETTLKDIGNQTGGNYTRVTCNADFTALVGLKELIEKQTPKANIQTDIPTEFIEVIWQDLSLKNKQLQQKYHSAQ